MKILNVWLRYWSSWCIVKLYTWSVSLDNESWAFESLTSLLLPQSNKYWKCKKRTKNGPLFIQKKVPNRDYFYTKKWKNKDLGKFHIKSHINKDEHIFMHNKTTLPLPSIHANWDWEQTLPAVHCTMKCTLYTVCSSCLHEWIHFWRTSLLILGNKYFVWRVCPRK